MAVPFYQIKHLIKKHDIHVFSSNYPLYADLSARIMHNLNAFSEQVDIYSIDEAFIDIGRSNNDVKALGMDIKQLLFRWVGIPVSVGIGSTKTLAKLANYAAKRWPKSGGVVDLNNTQQGKKIMQKTPVGEVWGVGKQYAKKLNELGINSAWDLQRQTTHFISQHFNISLAQTVQELKGIAMVPFNATVKPKQQIICSRSFKKKRYTQQDLAQTLAVFCLRAAEKLRAQQGLARKVSIFICSSPFDRDTAFSKKAHHILPAASQDSRYFLKVMRTLLSQIYKRGIAYQQAGVILSDIQSPCATNQYDLFETQPVDDKSKKLMRALDEINARFNNKLKFASTGSKTLQQSIPMNRSNRYTTNWNELVRVK